ncbi:MAG TPA: ABC transporter ATP-binding protein [Candidatus Dormibacteraeota bacterium]|nr:ABC transporter ATP-binding protein [Candidatus Dormibacteraeota bacterium]
MTLPDTGPGTGAVPLRPVPAIRLRGLTKLFGERVAVDGMSLDIGPGELFGFLGPNGAGKTTTMKLLVGLLLPTTGTAQLCGYDVVAQAIQARAVTGWCPDEPALYERLSGREQMRLVADLYGVRRDVQALRADPLLDSLGLGGRADDLIQSYSRGMRQKLSLACALLHDPRVLLLDEPMVGLDPAGARLLKDVLRGLCSQGRTVFLSTHVIEVAELLCDRVGVVRDGRLVAVGTPRELREASGGTSLEDAVLRLVGDHAGKDLEPLLRALEG